MSKPNTKDMIASQQSWIREVRKYSAAMALFHLWQKTMVPRSIRQQLSIKAKVAGVDETDLALANIAYEATMVAFIGMPKFHNLGRAILEAGAPATRWGCSALAVTDDYAPDGNCLHGRNLDWGDPDGFLRRGTMTERTNTELGEYYTVGFPGQIGVLTGTAPFRFSVSLNAVFTDEVGFGQAPVYLLRKVLDECKTFEEALKMICRTRLLVGALFMLVDGKPRCKGRAAVIERTPNQYLVRHGIDGGNFREKSLAVTNDYRGIQPKGSVGSGGGELQATSCKRYDAMAAGSKGWGSDTWTTDAMAALMTSPEVKMSCTVHTVIMDPVLLDEPIVIVNER